MKKISEKKLKEAIETKGLTIKRNNKPKPKAIPIPVPVVNSSVADNKVVGAMAQSLSESAGKLSQTMIKVEDISNNLRKAATTKQTVIVEFPKEKKKRTWELTPIRDANNFIEKVIIEEL